MSVHIIYYKDGAKLMRPVKDEMEYRLLRDSERNRGGGEAQDGADELFVSA